MTPSALLVFAGSAVAATLAVVTCLRRKEAATQWTFVLGMLVLALEAACGGLATIASTTGEAARWMQWRLTALSVVPGIWLLFALTYARGNAREFLAGWRPVLLAAFLGPVLVAGVGFSHLAYAYQFGLASEFGGVRLGWAGRTLNVLFVLTAVIILMHLERTMRDSVGMVRWRIKYLLLGLGALLAVRVYTASQMIMYGELDPAWLSLNAAGLVLGGLLMTRSLLRPGHFAGDVYPTKVTFHTSLTVFVAGFYLLIVGVFGKIAEYVGGDAALPLKTFLTLLLLVGLAVALQSDRVRFQVRRWISRHLQRPVHDYRGIWRSFAEATSAQLDRTELCRALVKQIADTFEALSVALWLVDERSETLVLAASTAMAEARARELAPDRAESEMLLQHFQLQPGPVAFEAVTEPWAETLRRIHPSAFPHGGARFCLPLFSHGEMLGLLLLGDRVGGSKFSPQDRDLLECVGHQAAAGLHNVQLSERLLQARELSAFQTMATFFVHDLKNAASTLNLMLRNLPTHWNDPEFRDDACRAIGKSVEHINQLVSRLSTLRHELRLDLQDVDLNDVVRQAVSGWSQIPGVTVTHALADLPPVRADREQLGKVITNLLLNGAEAVAMRAGSTGSADTASPPPGAVHIATERRKDSAVVMVTDNGCGMTEEFLQHSLFRPFFTTKKNGLGIGMFQSRMIIAAHGGSIAVESRLGVGTTFRVFLPLATSPAPTPPGPAAAVAANPTSPVSG